MSLQAIATLVAVGLIVAALAFYLVAIALSLRKTLFTLGTLEVGLRAIADRVEPLREVLTDITEDLKGAHEKTQRLAEHVDEKEEAS